MISPDWFHILNVSWVRICHEHWLLLFVSTLFITSGCKPQGSEGVESQKVGTSSARVVGAAPRANVDNPLYDFGVMEAGEEREHIFKITNEGDAKLILTPGEASCKCTKFEVDKRELEHGESAQATVRWRPIEVQEKFRQVAPIKTNDPESPEIHLNIVGIVKSIFVVKPGYTWDLGEFREGEGKEFSGFVFCNIDEKFEVENLKTTHPGVTAVLEPANDVELKKENAKSGYQIKLTAGKDLPIGQFRESLTFKCLASKEAEMRVELRGSRPGPFSIVGRGFVSRTMTWEIGSFDARKGYKQTLSLFYDGGEEAELQLQTVESDPPGILMSLKNDQNFKGNGTRKRYIVELEIPPGDKAQIFNEGKFASLRMKTNSEKIGDINLRLKYNALLN